ncbi:MAG: cytochrome P450 [Solirubrobacterales bacterium]|nr:cytochrome P450 [Solirubrobacterales bacterium]MBV9799832.1 cytochrome P450 [Solirubrobacterales bacterium]
MTDPIREFFLDDPRKLDDPFEDLAWLREHSPVHWHEPVKQWFVFPYDDVKALFADSRLSANRMTGFVEAAPEPVRDELRALVPYLEKWLVFRDGVDHARVRSVLHRGFNTRAIKALRAPIERAAIDLIDGRAHSGQLDVAGDYGFLLPAYVLSDFMGVPKADRDRIVKWSIDFVDFFNVIPITEDTTRRLVASATEMSAYTRDLLAERRTAERADFLGVMATAMRHGEITEDEIVGNTLLLLIAGHVAVRNLVGNVIWLLLEHPDEHQRLQAEPRLLRSVIEESLRMEPPVTLIPRIAAQDVLVGGRDISAGEIIQLSIAAANRDPSRFPQPNRFDAARDPRGLSFGHGPHGCLGARLAMEQSSIALDVLFRRLGHRFRLDEDRPIRWYRNAGNRGPEELSITFSAPRTR